jgi:methylmalonyl-CoA mutase C-terminal domain/subunit
MTAPIRVLVTKIGLDGHDRGSRVVASYLRDAGMEVIYTSPWQTLEAVVRLSIQEDVDVVGISTLATDHLIVPDLMNALENASMSHVGVVVGGIIPESERRILFEAGVDNILGPGASRDEIVGTIRDLGEKVSAIKSHQGEFQL